MAGAVYAMDREPARRTREGPCTPTGDGHGGRRAALGQHIDAAYAPSGEYTGETAIASGYLELVDQGRSSCAVKNALEGFGSGVAGAGLVYPAA